MVTAQYPKIYLYRRIVQAKLFIDRHFEQKMDLELIADEAHFSKFHFIRLFKSIYGQTPHQYLIYRRLEKAKTLLKQGVSVADACFSVGFESITSFSGLFTRTVGQTPSAFVRQYRQVRIRQERTPLAFVPGCYAYQHGWLENSNFEEGGK